MIKRLIFATVFLFSVAYGSLQAQDALLGEVKMFAGNFAPRGWALCEGQLLPISQNTALFSVLGTTYGGDGRTTFGLPDMRGRVVMGEGNGPGLSSRRLGERGGTETNTLTSANIPPLQVAVPAFKMDPTTTKQQFVEGNSVVISTGNTKNATVTAQVQGQGTRVNNMQPFVVLNYIICIQGNFPSRN